MSSQFAPKKISERIVEDAGKWSEQQNIEVRKRVSSLSSQNDERRKSISINLFKNDLDFLISPEDISDEYEQNEDQTGLFVLFNHETFDSPNLRKREGTNKDEMDLIDCLSRLKYEIKKEMLHKDLSKAEIEEELFKIAQMDYSKRNSLIVVFLTHGGEDGKLITSDDKYVTCEEVWSYFASDKCLSLKGKPKIFIFQACKGEKSSKATNEEIQVDGILRNEIAKKNYTLPAEADILVAYSTIEGNVSFRNTVSGSWFIQELCKNLTAYGRRDDIVTILTRVSKCVAYHYEHENEKEILKQMPCFVSTLTRKFYLLKSKERGYFLELQQQYKKLLENVDNVNKQLNEMKIENKNDYKKTIVKREQKDEKKDKIRKQLKSCSDKPRWK